MVRLLENWTDSNLAFLKPLCSFKNRMLNLLRRIGNIKIIVPWKTHNIESKACAQTMKGIYFIILVPLMPLMLLGFAFDMLHSICEDYPRWDIGKY